MSSALDDDATEPDDATYVHSSDHGPVDLPHATLKAYLTGFVLSVVLTVIPFWLVMGDVSLGATAIMLAILGLGAVQIYVHIVYFLHMNSQSENGWNLMALLFAIILVIITLFGSIWVMFHMNKNMMPMSPVYSQSGQTTTHPAPPRGGPGIIQ